jgi:hypothetical protein
MKTVIGKIEYQTHQETLLPLFYSESIYNTVLMLMNQMLRFILHPLDLVEGSTKAVSRLRESVSKVHFTIYVTELACSKCTQIRLIYLQVQDV